jgi:acetyltransferase-like isoleucine patch superfamily enzyme
MRRRDQHRRIVAARAQVSILDRVSEGNDELDRLLAETRRLYDRLRQAAREQWDRDLPLDELLFDRWQRARELGFGDGTSIYQSSYVYGDVRVGRDTWIGPFTILDGTGGLTIGDSCSISSGVHIYTHDTVSWAVTGGAAPYEHAPVSVGDCCYVGPHAVVAKGVAIGEHSVVGAGSYVNRDLAPYSIAVGAPCRAIGSVRLDGADVTFEYDRS